MPRAGGTRIALESAKSGAALVLSLLVVILIFAADLYASPTRALAALYVIPIVFSLWATQRLTAFLALLASALTVVVMLLDMGGSSPWVAVAYRASVIAAIATVALLVRHYKSAERSAARERSQAEHYLDVAEVMIVALDGAGEVTLINSKGCQLLGYPREQIVGKNWLESFVPEREWDRVRRVFQQVVSGQLDAFTYFENAVRTSAGAELLVAWHNTVLHDDGGRIVATLSSGTDITAAKAAERALWESEQRYRHLFETASDFILVADLEGHVLYANRAWKEATGYSARDPIPVGLAQLLDPPSLQRWRATCDAQLAGQSSDPVELTFSGAGGRQIVAEGSLTVRADMDQPPAVQGILRDVTARREIERMKDEFVAVVSHELRTPLTAIRGSLGLLEAGVLAEISEPARELVLIGRVNADRLIRLVGDILDLERVVSGVVPLNLEPLTVGGLVEPTMQALSTIAAEAKVALQLEAGMADDVAFAGDKDRLAQVLTNLLDNAIKYSPQGACVTVRSEIEADQRVRICVQDRGPGIAKQEQLKLFQRFGMLDSSNARKKGGSGLGLAITKAIVDLHGGRVGVESDVGQGSTFFFSLPVAPHSDHRAI